MYGEKDFRATEKAAQHMGEQNWLIYGKYYWNGRFESLGYVDAGGKTEICRYVVVDTSENAVVFVVAADTIAMLMVVLRNGIIVKASEAVEQ